ncbi:allophanate hydrolase 2 subunit 2 [Liquorilactobacillus sucicola DSM 21376 = JCM 15457]|uniref:Carboxyltransferase domain-containing protein n=1 Tax=Liquorilactobacillus sucicola DSM 21376 = JCM 15457 TaxID=1423806 RepID=A0A023CW10_9LACO|nr:biotin-dependent carboxyltransferase family protein [Liquorilactobacillus sucicola]KRN05675.1 hypothetical protein FD15_GL002239 [Liquorilactobacillus sucicola DSM 21376 = JCM 15457]GAJ25761.1 allophanate hydrolase 2 subunit 2 [Liquorilactobacillus sucicola DSM 21376 = JCM 15457]
MKTVEILDGGLATTIQDLGRPNYQAEGIPVSGAVDNMAQRLANVLVDNEENAATLEFCMLGPKIRFYCTTFIAITGGESCPTLDGQQIFLNRVYRVETGSILMFKPLTSGRYGYVAVANGGFFTKPILNSRSTTVRLRLGGLKGRVLQRGDRLPLNECFKMPSYQFREFSTEKMLKNKKDVEIRVVKGPQWNNFTAVAQERFRENLYVISQQADRMGYRLSGTRLPVPDNNMLSEGTILGNIQITRDGLPIVLLTDRQTTGGYPVIATVVLADLRKLVQLDNKHQLRFKVVSFKEATAAFLAQRTELKKFKIFLNKQRYRYPIGPARKTAQKIEQLLVSKS